jgi:hypothetical protein
MIIKRKLAKFFVFLSFGITFSGCASFVNWGKRINLTVGGGLPSEVESSISGINHVADTITIRDGFGDTYRTSWEFKEKEPDNIPVAVNLSIPIYWKDFDNGMGVETGFMSKVYIPHVGLGGYIEGSAGPISINASIGFSAPTEQYYETASEPASPAWAGDPGIYINGKFHNPSSFKADVGVYGEPSWGIFSSIALKWHFIKWLYLEGGYSYYGKTEEKITGITVDTDYTAKEEYDMDGFISLSDRHLIYIGLGIGH